MAAASQISLGFVHMLGYIWRYNYGQRLECNQKCAFVSTFITYPPLINLCALAVDIVILAKGYANSKADIRQ